MKAIRGFTAALALAAAFCKSQPNPDTVKEGLRNIFNNVATRSKGKGTGQKARKGKTMEIKRRSKTRRNVIKRSTKK